MASWNPALRPENETSVLNTNLDGQTHPSTDTITEALLPGSAEERMHNATESSWKFSRTQASVDLGADDDFFTQQTSSQAQDHAATQDTAQTLDSVNGIATDAEARESEESPTILEPPENTSLAELEHAQPVAEIAAAESEAEEVHRPEENYEHQGETTLLEEAVEPDASVPLVQAAEPSLEWDATEEETAFDFNTGTAPTEDVQTDAADLGWGDDNGEDIDFGVKPTSDGLDGLPDVATTEELADRHNDTTKSNIVWGDLGETDADFGVTAVENINGGQKQEDLDAMWAAALDDDEDEFLADDNNGDRSAFLFDDNEGFLDDFSAQLAQAPETTPSSQTGAGVSQPGGKYAPASSAAHAVQPVNQYLPQGPQLTDLSQSQSRAPSTASLPAYGGYGQTSSYGQQKRPALTSSAQSFADKAKGGYASPYDLPTDIAPKKRPAPVRPTVPSAQSVPPPRSSSMQSFGSTAGPPPPLQQMGSSTLPAATPKHAPRPRDGARSGSSGFFEELPSIPRTRPSATGRYTPQPSPALPSGPPQGFAPPQQHPSAITANLRQPERLPAYADQSQPPAHTAGPPLPVAGARYSPAPGAVNSRYSPAPPQAPATAPPVGNKYAPSPSNVPPPASYQNRVSSDPASLPRSASQSFLPRTSSPLAQHHVTREPETAPSMPPPSTYPAMSQGHAEAKPATPPPPRSIPSSMSGSPNKQLKYAPQHPATATSSVGTAPPRRQTSSPGTLKSPPQAYPSAQHSTPFTLPATLPEVSAHLPARGAFSSNLAFIAPNDERAADPLERWKGYPVFTWGLGGTVVTSFPSQVPRYGNGSSAPMIKCSPGEIKVANIKTVAPLPESINKFPGPLKSKGKKKDVLAWLKAQVSILEKASEDSASSGYASDEDRKRQEERLVLWRVLSIFIEHDGKLEGTPAVEQAVRQVLFSGKGEEPSRVVEESPALQAEPADPAAVEKLRQLLAEGEREKAAWYAVDQKLWGHAMLVSSTLGADVWKRVAQEFVRLEVKRAGSGNQSLAALYEVFAGNWDDSTHQLVPASTRAGFSMISTSGTSNNALEGLDKWRETLLLILSNRTNNDEQAIISLAKLLTQYHRTDAAHICTLFARSKAQFGGAEDPATDLVLFGADHHATHDVGTEIEAIILTEVYEFGLTLSSTVVAGLPHLQPYKLAHAYALAEYGYRTEAQKYCDSIAATIKSTTKGSPYYNINFVNSLDDLTKRLSQAPKDGSSSWFSKPSMDKVSGSFLNRFTSFVAGDDSEDASKQSGSDTGPYASLTGGTPTISPTQSNVDLYSQFRGTAAPINPQPSSLSSSRYGPTSAYTPTVPTEQTRTPSNPYAPNGYTPAASQELPSAPTSAYTPSMTPSQYSPSSSQMPIPIRNAARPQSSGLDSASYGYSGYNASPYQPSPLSASLEGPLDAAPAPAQPSLDDPIPRDTALDAPASFDAPSTSYEPPSMGSYEPPAYVPYEPEKSDDEDSKSKAPKKKSFMDDDDDDELAKQAEVLKKQRKAQADKEAEENFRKVAEADAAKASSSSADPNKKGWFGGWFKKDPNAGPGPIKAKLGEESSFVYDEATKKWVNKKAGAATPVSSAPTPPPPRGPPSRVASNSSLAGGPPVGLGVAGAMKPPPLAMGAAPTSTPARVPSGSGSGPPSRVGTPASAASGGEGPEGAAPPLLRPPVGGLATGPPSRPGTGTSNASSIDDLLGAPQARKAGGAKKPKRAARYVDVMQK